MFPKMMNRLIFFVIFVSEFSPNIICAGRGIGPHSADGME